MLKPGNRYIIKPVWEDGSLGITGDSVFTYTRGLKKNLQNLMIPTGLLRIILMDREFNISVSIGENGPEVMPPAEMVFHNFDDNTAQNS